MGVFSVLRTLLRYLASFPGLALAVLATVLFDTLFETALPLTLSWLIDHAVVPGRADLFVLPALLIAGGWLVSVAGQVGRDWWLADLSARVQHRIRQTLAEWIQTLPFARVRGVKPAEWLSMHTSDLVQIENLILNVLPPFLFGVFYLAFGVAAMVVTHAGLGALVFLSLPLALVGPWLLRSRASREGKAAQGSEVEVTAAAQDRLAAQPLLRTFDLAAAFDRGVQAKAGALLRFTRAFSFTGNLTRRLPNLTIHLAQLVIILAGTWLALQGQLKIGEFLAFNLLFANVMTAVLDLASTLQPLLRAAAAFERLEAHRSDKAAAPPSPPREATPRLNHGLRFDGVWFGYDPSRQVLSDLSLTIPVHQRTAIVGASGSGKSTLAALLAGLYQPHRGRILWDDRNVADADRASYLERLGVVFQDNVVFDASLRYNIILRDARPEDEAAVWESLEGAGLAAWVKDLPEGLDTRAGEGGGFLSGGQRQRLALARALFRRPDLLLLDEATSALDPMTEAQVNDTLRVLAASTTIVHITHRLQGIADYDRIVVLGQGRVLETGTHTELTGLPGGVYASLWQRQSGLVVDPAEGARITPEGLRAIPLFASSGNATLAALAASFVSETARAGTRIIHQGRPGSRFFVVARGRVEVSIAGPAGEQVVASLADGDFFGEMSLLGAAPTSAHVTASQPTILLSLEKTTFLALLQTDPTLRQAVEAIARRRQDENARRTEGG